MDLVGLALKGAVTEFVLFGKAEGPIVIDAEIAAEGAKITVWELLVPVLASLGLAIGGAGRKWGVDAWLSQRWPSSPWW